MGTPNTDLKEYATANQEEAACIPAEPIVEETEQTEVKEPADKEA